MDIVWIFACAWTVSSADVHAEAQPSGQQYDSDSVLANLEFLCRHVNMATSHASVLDGALLAVIRSLGDDGAARSGNFRSFVLGLSELLTKSVNGGDLSVYLFDGSSLSCLLLHSVCAAHVKPALPLDRTTRKRIGNSP